MVSAALLGVLLAAGLLLVWSAFTGEPLQSWSPLHRPYNWWLEIKARAQLSDLAARLLVVAALLLPVISFLLVWSLTRAWSIALCVSLVVIAAPVGWVNQRIQSRRETLARAWPDVTDTLLAAIRAGVALPEAVLQLTQTGPSVTRPYFQTFARQYRITGRFDDAIEAFQNEVVDAQADRLCEALRLAREVGGSELGNVLRDLSMVMREDVRVRGELLARQSWTINAARLAVIAPWLVLVLISTRTDAARAYLTTTGITILAIGAVACLGAYLVMRKIATGGVQDLSQRRNRRAIALIAVAVGQSRGIDE